MHAVDWLGLATVMMLLDWLWQRSRQRKLQATLDYLRELDRQTNELLQERVQLQRYIVRELDGKLDRRPS